MQTQTLIPGTPEWHAHRAKHFNASDAPAMLGCSPYTTRSQLLQRLHTGLAPEVDGSTQRRFDDGHRFEALARPLAEEIIGDDLAPVVGTVGRLSASFDGLTLMSDIAFEHKTLNDDLRAALANGVPELAGCTLPKHYRVQMEQQCMVSGCERVLFMASKWEGSQLVERLYCWYYPDAELRAEIQRGWAQFEKDLAEYAPPAAAGPAVVAEPVQSLPAVSVQVTGELMLRDNFKVFETALRDFLEHRLIRKPTTDQDFADLDLQIKAMKGAEAALDSAEAQMLAQIQTVDQAKKTKDMLTKLVRDNRLMAERLLKDEKERRRGEIVAGGIGALKAHIDGLNQRLGKPYMPTIAADFAGCIKGKSALAKMEDAVATELARAKIAANEVADRIDANLKHLRDHAADYKHLFPDAAAIVQKACDDLQALVSSRIADHKAAEERRLEAERARIRAEEVAKIEREQAAERRRQEDNAAAAAAVEALAEAKRTESLSPDLIDDLQQVTADLTASMALARAANVVPMPTKAPAPAAAPTLRLGQINERIAPLSIDAAGLASLGFPHAATDKAAKLFHEADFPRICAALIARLQSVQHQQAAA